MDSVRSIKKGDVARGSWVWIAKPETGEEGREKATGLCEGSHYHISRSQIMRKSTLQWRVQTFVEICLHMLTLHHSSTDGNDMALWSGDMKFSQGCREATVKLPGRHLLCHSLCVSQYICICSYSFDSERSKRLCFPNTFSWGSTIRQEGHISKRDTTD